MTCERPPVRMLEPMGSSRNDDALTREALAWEFVELFDELSVENVNEMLANNVPLETLRFISQYTDDFADVHDVGDVARRGLPNLMVFGYLLRVLEDRLLDDDPA